ncbi:PREDICTED: uncharacterized protein LOC105147745 [Acromyrmex echinatior]|uniref:uncharacterized protein LOC105147745 n=1 Tax=Acromyrmex echinatior TaxID=103372 RepID=UPI000580DA73|nr:PREDICTED: uncharacterized protein LOC105147745 [Acromyrmex echinatior]
MQSEVCSVNNRDKIILGLTESRVLERTSGKLSGGGGPGRHQVLAEQSWINVATTPPLRIISKSITAADFIPGLEIHHRWAELREVIIPAMNHSANKSHCQQSWSSSTCGRTSISDSPPRHSIRELKKICGFAELRTQRSAALREYESTRVTEDPWDRRSNNREFTALWRTVKSESPETERARLSILEEYRPRPLSFQRILNNGGASEEVGKQEEEEEEDISRVLERDRRGSKRRTAGPRKRRAGQNAERSGC